jgi:hypothetical protein
MILARNAIDEHAQYFETKDQLIQPILKAFAHYTLLEMTFAFRLCVVT